MTTKTMIFRPETPGGIINAVLSENLLLEIARCIPDAGKRYKKAA